jgi:hypothetical protein
MATVRARQRSKFEAMLAARLATILAVLLICVSFAANADESPVKPEAPLKSVEAEPDAEKIREFKLPPGFRARKRGDLIVYCRKEAVVGSRFPAEKCYDEAGIRELRRLELERTEMLEKIRACGTGSCSTG